MHTNIIYTKGEVAGKGIYEHGQGYVYCNRHRDMSADSIYIFIFLKNKSGYAYETEHTRRRAPNTDIQPGRKKRIHTRYKHKQDTGNS